MKLFLTSAGLPPETRDYFLKELPKKPEETKVAFIPTAADPEADKWFVKSALDELAQLKFPVFQVDLKEPPEKIRQELDKADIIYINGGNTFYLLDWVRKSGLDKYLPELLNKDKIYLGVSAGSIIVGPDIALAGLGTSGDKNNYVKDATGLKFVDFVISPHYTEEERATLEDHSRSIDYPVIALTNSQAVLVKDNNWQIIGSGEAVYFGKKI